MNKTELISKVAEKSGLTNKNAEKAVNAFTETVTESLKSGNDVQLVGFGSFQVKKRAARDGHHPSTGKKIKIAPQTYRVLKRVKDSKRQLSNS